MKLKLKTFITFSNFLLYVVYCSSQLHCRDENNEKVDWFILYKLPKISKDDGKYLKKGEAYAYITPSKSNDWTLSSKTILSKKSMLGRTWRKLKDQEKTSTYLFYNDEAPQGYKGSASGHLKGFLAFGEKSGYWVMHTIPKFGRIKEYEYPKNALENGQTVICVNFKISELNKICKHLLFTHPKIHLKKLSDKISSKLNEDSKSLFGKKPKFVRSGTLTNEQELRSAEGQKFLNLAKASECREDFYGDIIAPAIKSSLLVESWRRGRGEKEQKEHRVRDITAINMTVNIGRKKKSISFKSLQDHSKWAISVESKKKWICMTDMNRMVSQQKRGGGALCFQSSKVWRAFYKIISETEA